MAKSKPLEPETTYVLSDQATIDDELGHYELAKEIGQAIEYCQLPQVFGLHGDWGAGKTSLLHQIQFYLTGECPHQPFGVVDLLKSKDSFAVTHRSDEYVVIWFEAWKYQNEPVPIVALLHEMRAQLSSIQKVISNTGKMLSVGIKSALFCLEDVTKKVGIQASKIQSVGEAWEKEHLASKLPSDDIRSLIQHAIDGLIGNEEQKRKSRKKHPPRRKRLVVLIDDLDRCEPKAAYQLLEGLKIYLTLNNTVFLLGMNQRIVEDAIAKNISVETVPDDQKSILLKERAGSYMEKICQNIWRTPMVEDPTKVMLSFYRQMHDSNKYMNALIQAFDGIPNCLPPNPRRLKSFANLLYRYCKRLPEEIRNKTELSTQDVRQIRVMLIVAYVYQFHHDVYRRWCIEPGLTEVIRLWCRQQLPERTQRNTETKSPVTLFEELFPHVRRRQWFVDDPNSPTPKGVYKSAYPDPAESTVFWIQPIVNELDRIWPINPSEFAPYLNVM